MSSHELPSINSFSRGCLNKFWTQTHARGIGFFDYTSLINAATDNSFLLYYNTNCVNKMASKVWRRDVIKMLQRILHFATAKMSLPANVFNLDLRFELSIGM